MANELTFLEFFAGGGMAGIGLGRQWRRLFANDFDEGKRAAYGVNFGLDHYRGGDIHALALADLPLSAADLAWASSPCQDLSLAGARGGLGAARSGAFFGFWRLIEALDDARRAPRTIVLENVAGLLTSRGGADFASVVERLAGRGYCVTALVLNAADFVPQSRPRLFIIGAREDFPGGCAEPSVRDSAAPPSLRLAVAALSPGARASWRWIAARPATARSLCLADILDRDAPFDPSAKTRARLASMSAHQRAAIDALIASGARHVGAGYRRVRVDEGNKRVRFEARFDGLSGCIRTSAGGSSRQVILDINRGRVRSRLMTAREAARAMGLPDTYILPTGATAALKLIGDGVAPPVVRWLASAVIEPSITRRRAAA